VGELDATLKMELADSGKWGIKLEWGSGDGVCRYFTACEAAVVATGVHAVAPLLLLCATVRFTKPIEHRTLTSESAPPLGASRSRETAILLAVCVLLDGVAAALPLLSHVVPGMITLTAQVSAVSGAATWSATCALLLVLFSAEHALDSSLVIVVWCFFDMFGGVLSLADAACGGTGSSGVLWRSVGAVLVLLSVCVRLFLLLLRFMPRLRVVSLLEPEDNEMDAPDDVSFSLSEETHVREGTVTWGQGEPLPALGNTLENSSWLAQMLITWPGRVLSAARVRALFHGDVSEAPAEAHPALALDTLLLLWARPSREAAASRAATAPNHTTGWQRLGWILWRMHRVSWSMALALRVLAVMLRLAALLLLLLHVLAPPTPLLDAPSRLDADATPPGQGSGEEDSWKQRGAVAGLVLCLVVSAVIAVQGHLYLAVEEIKIRNLLWAVLYRTAISQQAHTPALCTQRFSGAKELDKVCRSVDAMASAVEGVVEQLVASLALALLLPPWGAMAAATLGACTVLRVLAVVVGGMRARLWERVMSAQADRVAACEQHLDGILALKQLAWEHAMAQRVFVLRRREQRALRSLLTMDSICDGLGHGGGLVAGCLLSFALVDLPLSSAAHPSLVPTSAHLLSGLLLVVVMWWRARMLPTYVWVVMRGKRGLEALDATLQPTTRSTHHNTCSAPPSFSPPPAPDALVVMANSQGCGGGGGGGGEESDGEAKVEQQDGEGGQLLVRLHKVSVAWPIPSQIPSPPWAERQARFWRVLEDVDLVVHAGERVAVVGGGGSGKTSLLMGLMGEASIQTLAAGPTRPWSCVVNNADAHASGFLFVSRPASVSMRRAWVEEEVSVEANVIGWQRLDPRLLSQTLDLCGLRPHGHASSTSASEAPTKRLLERCLDGGWPEQLRERVGLARCVYAAALACGAGDTGASSASGSSCPPSCLVLLDEPLASIEPVHVRMQQLERILRSSLLSRAGIVLACRDSRISHLGVNKVLLLRSSRALAVAPPAPVSGMQTPGDSLAVASTEAARYGQSIHFDQLSESSPSVWNLDGEQEQGEGSSYLLLQPTDDSGSDDNADSPLSSAQPSPQRPKRVRATYGEEGGVVTTEETEDGQAWGQWLMMNRRPHGAGGVCHCEWGCKGLEQLETSCRRYPFPRAGPSTTQQAHLGRTLVKMLHGNKTRTAAQDEDDVVLTCAPACLVLLHGIAAASCVCAPYVLMLVFGESLSSSPDSAAATARLQASPGMIPALPCPPWTPCSCNCTIRVAGAWQAVSQQVSTGDHSPFVYMYCGMLASACLCALVGCIVASGVSTALSASVAAAGQGRWRWNASRQAGHGGSGSVEQDDVVLRVVMRASRAVCTALLQPEMIDRLKCALRASDSVPSLDAVPSRVPLCQPVCARQALLGVVVHATYIAVAIAWLVVVWPTLALVVSVLMLWGAYLGAQLSCSRMQLETLWRTPACTQLDRLWVALRNGVELRACQGAREAEEAAMYVSLSRAAAMSMTCVGTHLLSTLRLQLLGITLTCLPAVLAAVSSHPASTQGHDTRAGGAVYLDELLLAGLGVLVGLWCWAHWDALFVSFGSLAQVRLVAPLTSTSSPALTNFNP
jgi:ABC-type multidrug transport system fused ATPase/permease subunit